MKKVLIGLLMITLTSCFGISHNPPDFRNYTTIVSFESYESKNGAYCLYHCTAYKGSSFQANITEAVSIAWFVDDCNKYNIGDTITLVKE